MDNLLSNYINDIKINNINYNIPFYIPSKNKKLNNIIPFNIYQTLSSNNVPKDMYKTILNNLEKNQAFNYYLYDDNDCIKFIKENFNEEILFAYTSLVPAAYKADLWRYCIIYKYGGIYLDIKFKIMTNLEELINKNNTILVKDSFREGSPYDIYQGLIIAEPKLKIFKIIINRIVENVKNNFYGINVLHPTGPTLFGNLINEYNLNNLIKLHFDYPLLDYDENKNLIGRHVIKNKNNEILFENYSTYRIDQKNIFKKTNTKYYMDLWIEGKNGELNSNHNKNKNNEFIKGIYK